MGNLFHELKRRKVFRVAAVYAVVAWLLIEVTSTVLPTFDAPTWVNQTITLLLILGFPIALILSWAYEVTPEGIRTDAGAQPVAASVPSTDRNLIYLILVLVVMVAGFQIADRFLTDQTGSSVASNQTSSSSDSNTRVVRSTLPLGELLPVRGLGIRTVLSLSADGSRFAYTSSNGSSHQIYIRDLDQLEPRPLGPPLTAVGPVLAAFLSPDGEWVFFKNENNMWKISVSGGPAQLVTENVETGGFAFGADDTLYFADPDMDLRQVAVTGGSSQSLGIPFIPEMSLQLVPHSLPGEGALLFTRASFPEGAGETGRIELFDLETQVSRVLIESAYMAMYSPSGHITFIRGGSLWAVPFDLDSLAINGPEVLLIEGIEEFPVMAAATYSLSDSGNLLYVPTVHIEPESGGQKSVLAWVDRTGAETVLDMEPQLYRFPVLSPDSNRVVLMVQQDQLTQQSDLWSYELERGTLSRVTYSGLVSSALWSIDGNRLIYGTKLGIRSVNSVGIGQVEELTQITAMRRYAPIPTSISPDGQQILFTYFSGQEQSFDIHTLSLTPEHQTTPLINSEFGELGAAISPDGRWLAYQSDETGRMEVYVRPYPEIESGKWQISTEGAAWPMWSSNSKELFYRHGIGEDNLPPTQTLMVTIETEPEFRASSPQILFTSDHYHGLGAYAISADGQRFLMLKPVASGGRQVAAIPTHVVLVENFDEELKRLEYETPADRFNACVVLTR